MSKKIKRLYLFLTLKLLFPWQYRRFRKLPLKKWKAVFIEANLTQLSGSLRFLYQRRRDGSERPLSNGIRKQMEIYSECDGMSEGLCRCTLYFSL